MLQSGNLLQNRYRILHRLGGGGMGAVYLAEDSRLPGRRCAIKEMSPDQLAAQDRNWAIQAFQQEAQMLANLRHPGLTLVTDYFPEYGNWYLVMDFIEGETLAAHLASAPGGRLPVDEALRITRQLCEVLTYLHNQNPPVIFRDLKPGNVMLTPQGDVKLIDFGIARFFKSGKSGDTVNLGTPGYAAPEQYGRMGLQSGPRADVYSLGALLLQMITGYDPTTATTPFPLPVPRTVMPNIPPHIDMVIAQATQVQPDLRYGSIREMEQALAVQSYSTKNRKLLVGGSLGILMVLAMGAALIWAADIFPPVTPTLAPAITTQAPTTVAPPLPDDDGTELPSDVKTPTHTPTLTSTPTGTPTQTPTPTTTPTFTPASSDKSSPWPLGNLVQVTEDSADEYVPSLSPDQQTLLLMSNRIGNWQIFTVNLENQQWQRITTNKGNDYHPRFSVDGAKIIFSSDSSGARYIYTMHNDGTNWQQLTQNDGDTYPTYSSDGRSILFMSQRSGTWGVYIMESDGSRQRVVIDTAANETFPYISPDGTQAVFQSDATGNHEIYLISIASGEQKQLTYNSARDANPVFSPDGKSIAFETNRDGHYEIYWMDTNGNNQRNLTQSPGDDQVPSFSPDGKWLIFQSNRKGSWDIFALPLVQQ